MFISNPNFFFFLYQKSSQVVSTSIKITMTVSDEVVAQDRDVISGLSSHLDIADVIRTLEERAKVSDARANALAERVSLLESQVTNNAGTGAEKRPSLYSPYEQEISPKERPPIYSPYESEREISPFQSRHNVRLELGTGSFQDIGYDAQDDNAIQTVVGVAEDKEPGNYGLNDPFSELEARLQDRLNRIEDRLIDCEEETRGSFANNEIILPESTFSLLVTEHPISSPFMFAIFTATLSLICLGLVLADSVQNGTEGNQIAIP